MGQGESRQPVYGLVARGTMAHNSIQASLREYDAGSDVLLDLRRAGFCEPIALVALATLAERATRRGRRVELRAPINDDVSNYLARMRLGAVLDAMGVEHDLRPVREHHVGDALLELSRFEGPTGVDRLARLVHRGVERHDRDAADVLHDALCETGQNVTQHSGRSWGYMAAQRMHQTGVLKFAVADSGVGLLSTLKRRGASDDREAIGLALSEGVSGTDRRFRGNGLPTVLEELLAQRGSLAILSGSARTFRARDHAETVRTHHGLRGTSIQGTARVR